MWDGTQSKDRKADTGYTKICSCGARFAEVKRLIGQPRDVSLEPCPRCAEARQAVKERKQPLSKSTPRAREMLVVS
jgi:hypothetical protein